jgi:hypothetical protein
MYSGGDLAEWLERLNSESEFLNFLRSPRIDSNESILTACVAWRTSTTTLFLLGS